MTWAWFQLSENPDVERKLHDELNAVLGGRIPTVDDFPRLRYTEMVITEAMRLYPPAWIMGRRALDDYQVGPYTIPARAIVIISQYVMHHDMRYFPDPFRFDPERWTPEARASRPQFSYFPFGGGPRLGILELRRQRALRIVRRRRRHDQDRRHRHARLDRSFANRLHQNTDALSGMPRIVRMHGLEVVRAEHDDRQRQR